MKKGFFNAILFGGMIALSAGTFVACSDYDDDIDNLQEQINSVNSTLTSLQTEVRAGKWISSLTPTTNGFTVVFSDGTTYTIQNGTNGTNGTNGINGTNGKDGAKGETGATGAAGKDGTNGTNGVNGKDGTQITIGTDGYWYLDGVKSEYKATASTSSEDVKVPHVGEDGFWYFYEDGEAVKSNYKANGAAYAVKGTDGVWILTVPDASGTLQTINLPTAASKITRIDFLGSTSPLLNVKSAQFKFNKGSNTNYSKRSDWKGSATLPDENNWIVSDDGVDPVFVQVSPSGVAPDVTTWTLQDSKLNTLPVTLTVSPATDDEYTATRASSNDIYKVTVKTKEFTDNAYEGSTNTGALTTMISDGSSRAYSIVADGAFRSLYSVGVDAPTNVTTASTDIVASIATDDLDANNRVVVGKATAIKFVDASSVYDKYITVDQTIQDAYGITVDNAKGTFTVGKNPDAASTQASSNLGVTVHAIAVDGTIVDTPLTFDLSSIISENDMLALKTVDVSASHPSFDFNLATANINTTSTWKLNADLTATQYFLVSDKADAKKDLASLLSVSSLIAHSTGNDIDIQRGLFHATITAANATTATANNSVASRVLVTVDNDNADGTLKLNTEYYLVVVFTDGTNELNRAIQPVKFTAPAVSAAFTMNNAYVVNGVINAYFNVNGPTNGSDPAVDLKSFFTKPASASWADYTVEVDNDEDNVVTTKTVSGTEHKFTSAGVAYINDGTHGEKLLSLHTSATAIDGTSVAEDANSFEVGYNKELIINVSSDDYDNWPYTEDSEKTYSFKIKLASPIMEGSIASATSSTISISAGEAGDGAKITSDMIKGYDYNHNAYNIVPDAVESSDPTTPAWSKASISAVDPSDVTGSLLSSATLEVASKNAQGVVTNGDIKVVATNISNTVTTTLKIKVTDAWNYVKTFEVPVQIVKNN